MKRRLLWVMLLTACGDGGGGGGAPPADADMGVEARGPDASAPEGVTYRSLEPAQRLLRASMALRGIRPSMSEYEEILADPTAYDRLTDAYLESPEFGRTVRQHFTEWMELDQAPDSYPAGFPAVGDLSGLGTHELNTSIIEAPGRLAEYIVRNNRPWTEIVTADYTLADGVVATVWGLPYEGDGQAWVKTTYTDGRPVAGVLSDGWVFTRMPSTENNRQRERASLIANALICHDYPGRPIEIPPTLDLTSEEAIVGAVERNPVCLSCHHTLDPLSSFFSVHYGLRIPELETEYPLQQYTPEVANDYRAPAWYGTPGENLTDLGRLISTDPRFGLCTVRRFYSELMHVEVEAVPQREIARFIKAYGPDHDVKALVRAIVRSEAFSAVEAEGPDAPEVGWRRATPQQLDWLMADLTGFRWWAQLDFGLGNGVVGDVPLMRDYLWGYRTLAGGPNNFDTTTHLRTVNPSTLLVLRSLAERTARHATESGVLFTEEGAAEGDRDAVARQLGALALRLYGEATPDTTAALDLYDAALAHGQDPQRAWAITLSGLLQDPRILFY